MSQSMHAPYGHFVETTLSFEEAIREAKSALSVQGFGILSEIDVAKTLKDKLGIDQSPLVILGACNPTFAHQAIVAEPAVALLLPCNVVVRQIGNHVQVSAIDASAMMSFVGNPRLASIAAQVDERLRAFIAAFAAHAD